MELLPQIVLQVWNAHYSQCLNNHETELSLEVQETS